LAGDAPDIFINKPRSFEEFWKAGYILDLTNHPWIHNVDKAVIEEATVDGHYIGIGCVERPQGLIYNIDMFEKNGLKPPSTHTEFINVCDYFVSKGINPLMHAFAYSSAAYVEHSCWANNMAINADEGDLYRKVQKGEASLAGSKWFTQSMVIFADHLKYMDPGDLSVDASTAEEKFSVGERPMFTYMGHIYGELKSFNQKGRFGIVPYPWSDNPTDNLLSTTLDQGASINANSKYINEALKFLEYLCSPPAGNIMTKNLKIPSPVKGSDSSLLGNDEYIDTVNEAKKKGVAAKYMVPEMTGEYRDTFRGLLSEFTALKPQDRNPVEFVKLMDKRLSEIN
jgi:raffinose/stachyose/melibiose transport system substrate-binding protein